MSVDLFRGDLVVRIRLRGPFGHQSSSKGLTLNRDHFPHNLSDFKKRPRSADHSRWSGSRGDGPWAGDHALFSARFPLPPISQPARKLIDFPDLPTLRRPI